MLNFFQGITQKIALALAVSLAGVAGLACQSQVTTSTIPAVAAPQTAIIESTLVPVQLPPATSTISTTSVVSATSTTFTTSTSSATSTTSSSPTLTGTADVIPNLLPLVALPPFVTTTTKKISLAKTIATTTTIVAIKKIPPISVAIPAAAPMPSAAPITAQLFLDDTAVSLKNDLNGLDRLTFVTNLGNAGTLSWGLLDTTVGGTGSIPEFDVTSSCNPPPAIPTADDPNQNPIFQVRTSYDCTISLTPLTGTDLRAVSKDFTFTTPPGRVVVSVAPDTDTLLQNNTNNGGFTFDNQDTQPITITGLTVDLSFNGVNVSNLFVLRFADPVTGVSLFDHPLTNSPETGVSIPLSLTIPAGIQKVLPVEAIGVNILQVNGTTPTVTVVLRGVTLSDSAVTTQIVSSQISWSCVVPTAAYDPYATSSPFLSGQACGN